MILMAPCIIDFILLCGARICKRLGIPGIDFKELIPPAYVACRAGTSNWVVPACQAGNRFLGSFKALQIWPLFCCVVMEIFAQLPWLNGRASTYYQGGRVLNPRQIHYISTWAPSITRWKCGRLNFFKNLYFINTVTITIQYWWRKKSKTSLSTEISINIVKKRGKECFFFLGYDKDTDILFLFLPFLRFGCTCCNNCAPLGRVPTNEVKEK